MHTPSDAELGRPGPTVGPLERAHAGIDRNTWCEHLYRYVEHYRWEPQHLQDPKVSHHEEVTASFYRRIREQEVPLNFLMNLLLRTIPLEMRWGLLRLGFEDAQPRSGELLATLYGEDQVFTQPDCLLETQQRRFFIELKVTAQPKFEQIRKYVHLHAHLDEVEGEKEPYLLFVSPKPIEQQWAKGRERELIQQRGLEAAAQELFEGEQPPLKRVVRFFGGETHERHEEHMRRFSRAFSRVRLGATTWTQVASELERQVDRREGELREVLDALVGDFLIDLGRRGYHRGNA